MDPSASSTSSALPSHEPQTANELPDAPPAEDLPTNPASPPAPAELTRPKSPPLAFQKTPNDSLAHVSFPDTTPQRYSTDNPDTSGVLSPDRSQGNMGRSINSHLQVIVDQQASAIQLLHQAFAAERKVWDLERESLMLRISSLEQLLKTGDHHRLPSIAEDENSFRSRPGDTELPAIRTSLSSAAQARRPSVAFSGDPASLMVDEGPPSPTSTQQTASPLPMINRMLAGHTPPKFSRPPTPPPQKMTMDGIEDTPTRHNTHINTFLTKSNDEEEELTLRGPLNLPELPTLPDESNFTLDALSLRLQQLKDHPGASTPMVVAHPSPGMVSPANEPASDDLLQREKYANPFKSFDLACALTVLTSKCRPPSSKAASSFASRLPSIAEDENSFRSRPGDTELPAIRTSLSSAAQARRPSVAFSGDPASLMVDEGPPSPTSTQQTASPLPMINRMLAGHTPPKFSRPPTPPPQKMTMDGIEDTPTRHNTHINTFLTKSNDEEEELTLRGPLNLPELPTLPDESNFTLDALSLRLQQLKDHPGASTPMVVAHPSPGMVSPANEPASDDLLQREKYANPFKSFDLACALTVLTRSPNGDPPSTSNADRLRARRHQAQKEAEHEFWPTVRPARWIRKIIEGSPSRRQKRPSLPGSIVHFSTARNLLPFVKTLRIGISTGGTPKGCPDDFASHPLTLPSTTITRIVETDATRHLFGLSCYALCWGRTAFPFRCPERLDRTINDALLTHHAAAAAAHGLRALQLRGPVFLSFPRRDTSGLSPRRSFSIFRLFRRAHSLILPPHRPKSTPRTLRKTPLQPGPSNVLAGRVAILWSSRRRLTTAPERCMSDANQSLPRDWIVPGRCSKRCDWGFWDDRRARWNEQGIDAVFTQELEFFIFDEEGKAFSPGVRIMVLLWVYDSSHWSAGGVRTELSDGQSNDEAGSPLSSALLSITANWRTLLEDLPDTDRSWPKVDCLPFLLYVDHARIEHLNVANTLRLTHFFHQELREIIYREILHPDANRIYLGDDYTTYSYADALVLFSINKQIYLESRKVFRDLNVFVRIETPWSEAQQHAWNQGQVPIIVYGEQSAKFDKHLLTASIDAANYPLEREDEKPFIILLEDLEKFTKSWQYTTLSHSTLNPNLRLTLQLRDPYRSEWEEKSMSKALQRRLLMPFAMVKDLNSVVIGGDPKPYPSVETELREAMRVPYPSPEECLRNTLRLKLEGNDELKAGRFEGALECYRQAWLAMHIVVTTTRRHIHADAYFNIELREPPFVGKNGQSERLILRVQLVANTCQAYLKLRDFEKCEFWGMRSINMLREAMGMEGRTDIRAEDEAIVGFPAAVEMGKVYYRTAIAKKELGDRSEARKLLRVAAIYLPRDELIRKEIAALALPLG
nr:hypothetical protein CFP56_24283 [Quercus suber]